MTELPQEVKDEILKTGMKIFKYGQKKAENTKLKEKVSALQDKLKKTKVSGKAGALSDIEKIAKRVNLKVVGQKSKATQDGFDKMVGKMPRTSTISDVERLVVYGLEVLAKQPPKPKAEKKPKEIVPPQTA